MERNWNIFISVHNVEQIDELITELNYLKAVMKSIIMHEDNDARNLSIQLENGPDKFNAENGEIFKIKIEY